MLTEEVAAPLKIANKTLWKDISFLESLRGMSPAGVGIDLHPSAISPPGSEV